MNVMIDTPFLAVDEFARRTGQTPRAVLEQCKNGKLPVRPREKQGEKYMINNALLTKQALEQRY
jgi:hypothetical protein